MIPGPPARPSPDASPAPAAGGARTAFITGIGGQDGSYLAELLSSRGYRVTGLSRRPPSNTILTSAGRGDVRVLHGDVAEPGVVYAALAGLGQVPDEVYHLASATSVARSWDEPADVVRVETAGAVHVLDAVRRLAPAATLVMASSCDVFGSPATPSQDEDTPIAPISPYGAAKACSLWLARAWRSSYRVRVSCALLFSHESPRRPLHFVSRKVSRAAAEIAAGRGRELHLGDLDAVRDWGAAEEYVDAMSRMARLDEPSDFVIGSGRPRTVRELCDIAFRLVGLDYRDHVRVDPALFRPADSRSLVADATRAANRLGWKAVAPLEEIMRRMVAADVRHAAEAP